MVAKFDRHGLVRLLDVCFNDTSNICAKLIGSQNL
jgi:hypothetical protein